MDFNAVCLLTSAFIGLLTGALGLRFRDKPGLSFLPRTLLIGSFWSSLAVVGTGLWFSDAFAAVHMLYLILTLGVPLASSIVLAQRWKLKGFAGTLTKVVLVLGLLPAPIGLYASHVEPFWLRTDRATVPNLEVQTSLRIGVLSDFQTPSVGDYERDALDTLLSQNPQLVLVPGDLFQVSSAEEFELVAEQFAAVLARLDAEAGRVVVVEGDTDDVARLQRLAAGTDVIVLADSVTQVLIDDQRVRIGGLTLDADPTLQQRVIDELVAADAGVVSILLTHRPDPVLALPESSGVDLVVAGHTHGGQVSVPFLGPPVTLTSVPREVAAGGLHAVNGNAIYVSTGVGRERHRAPQLRFGVRPSVGIIMLVNPNLPLDD